MDIKITAEHLKGRNNPWRVSMTFPSKAKEAVDGVETIHTRVDAKDEKAALAEGHAIFMRQLGRRGKAPNVTMDIGRAKKATGNYRQDAPHADEGPVQ